MFQIVGNIWRPISFFSKSFNATQSHWSTIQKEAYAIFHCCQQMDTLLCDRVFTIHTDHLNLTYMNNNPNSMVTRWSIAMQELNFKIHFVPGSQNKWADSRRSKHRLHRSLSRRHTRACHRGLIFKMDRAVPLQGQYGGVSMSLSSRTLRNVLGWVNRNDRSVLEDSGMLTPPYCPCSGTALSIVKMSPR